MLLITKPAHSLSKLFSDLVLFRNVSNPLAGECEKLDKGVKTMIEHTNGIKQVFVKSDAIDFKLAQKSINLFAIKEFKRTNESVIGQCHVFA
jgi:hypothetical protein